MSQKILVVDDDLFIRELYIDVLRGKGYEVDSAINGEDGLGKLKIGGYDLVLLDVMMPKLDGIGVLTSLSQNPPLTKNGHIILLTNLDNDPMIKDATATGEVSYVIKADITPAELITQVEKYLNNENSTN